MNIQFKTFRINDLPYQEIVDLDSDLRIRTPYFYMYNIGDHLDLSMRNKEPLFIIFDNEDVLQECLLLEDTLDVKLNDDEYEKRYYVYDKFKKSRLVKFGYLLNNQFIVSQNSYPQNIRFFRGNAYFANEERQITIINKQEEIIAGPLEDQFNDPKAFYDIIPKILSEDFLKFYCQNDDDIEELWSLYFFDYREIRQFGYQISFVNIDDLSDGQYQPADKELGVLLYSTLHSLQIENQLGINSNDVENSLFLSPTLKLSHWTYLPHGSGYELIFNYNDNGLAVVNFNNRKYFINRYLYFIGPEEGFENISGKYPSGSYYISYNHKEIINPDNHKVKISTSNGEGGLIEFNGNFIEEFLLYPQLFFEYDNIKIFVMDLFNADEIINTELLEREYIKLDKIMVQEKIISTKITNPEEIIDDKWIEDYILSDEFKEDILSNMPFILPNELKQNKKLLNNLIEEHNKTFGIIHSSFKYVVDDPFVF
jgi:hypothetical protein